MIQISPQMRILVAVEAVDFRKGIDGLARVCQEELQSDPYGGWLFVFRNRRGTAIKALTYDGRGFWLCQRRLSRGRFPYWPASATAVKSLEAHELYVLLAAGNPAATQAAPAWRPVKIAGG
jgi:transposase